MRCATWRRHGGGLLWPGGRDAERFITICAQASRPGPDRPHARAEDGRTTAVYEVEVTSEDGTAVANAVFTMYYIGDSAAVFR